MKKFRQPLLEIVVSINRVPIRFFHKKHGKEMNRQ